MRQDWVDIVKAITMISVVLLHIDYQYPQYALLPASVIIGYLWVVPVFFLVGGFFLNDNKMAMPYNFVKGKIKNLYLPILYFYIPLTLMHNWLIRIGFYSMELKYGGKSVCYWEKIEYVLKIIEAVFMAGREPILGAMWFAYVLFLALCYVCIVTFVIKHFFGNNNKKFEFIRAIFLMAGCVLFSFLTEIFDYTIPRFNNVFTAAWLIYVGMLVNQKIKVKFDNKYLFFLSLMIFYSYAVLHGKIHMNRNDFGDIGTLTLSALSALYIVAFISKNIKGTAGKVLSMIGRDSFYIMALHFMAFKICSLILNMFGGDYNPALLEAPAYNIFLYLYYAVGGVFMPLLFIHIWRKGRMSLCSLFKKK